MRTVMMSLLCVLLFSPVAKSDDVATAVAREGVKAAFEEFERQMIYKYFDEHDYDHHYDHDYDDDRDYKKSKKGKNKDLPPGIKQKLARGGTMPPGIAKRYLPDDLEYQLPPAPQGYERTVVGNDVLLVEIDTGKIADIVTDAILGE